ncbi:related to TAM domain methyltransferase [Cephalotrichum gorgonifer]|uniref:Related to TAM domain methyltransferase n=1 Tax=Cephalotrichum gorgonifer TaxID=2041049 RepID=A0AAE8SWY8_9PEZI|nr:related to TAM domain methyltransferase [Cephalotrichum gorgonifer]
MADKTPETPEKKATPASNPSSPPADANAKTPEKAAGPGSKPSSPAKADTAPSSPAPADPAPADPAPTDPAPADPAPADPAPSAGGVLPADHWTQEPLPEDNDSVLGESLRTETDSLRSSIFNYRTIHGRRYHSEVGNAEYWGSNDEQQMESMDLNHYGLTLGIGNKLFLAPLDEDKLQRVLDIGTGTGIWAIDFADQFPQAQVTGTDISPIQSSWVPPNLKFEIEDCTLSWTFPEASMDYVHMRWLNGSITDWTAFFKEAYKTCRPGGWAESSESSGLILSDYEPIPDTTALGQWSKVFAEGGKKIGRSFTIVEDGTQRKAMEEAGFVNIQEYNYQRPLGSWPKDPVLKEMGSLAQAAWEADIEGYILFIANTLGWTTEQIQVYIAHLRYEMRSGKYRGYIPQKVVWGQRPE